MAFTIYRYVLTDRFGNARGELTGAIGRSLQRKLNGIDTASVTVSLTDPVARYLLDPDQEHRLKVYRQDGDATPQLIFYGPVVDVETVFSPTSGSAAINAASPLWNLTHRFAFKRIEGGIARQHLIENGKRAQVALDAVTRTVSQDGPIGLAINGFVPDSGDIGVGEPFDASWRNVAELLTELSSGQLNSGEGFDFFVVPSDSLGSDSMGTLVFAERRGQARPSAIFETGIGTRNNAVEARQTATRSGVANSVFHVPGVYSNEDMQDGEVMKLPVMSKVQSASVIDRGCHEAVLRDDISDVAIGLSGVSASGGAATITTTTPHGFRAGDQVFVMQTSLVDGQRVVVDAPSATTLRVQFPSIIAQTPTSGWVVASGMTSYRQRIVDMHAAVRQRPRRAVTFQPAPEEQGPSVPKAVADYDVGDTIRLRVVAPNGAIAINDDLRIYSIETAVDDQAGTGQHTLTLVPEE